MITRRKFIAALGSVPILAGLYTWRIEPHWLEFVHRDLPVRNLSGGLAGKRLVQLSDVHIGPDVDDAYLVDALKRTAALEPDIVVHTGDLITYRGPAQFVQAQRILAHFPKAKLGSVAILGNHDYGSNWSQLEIAAEVERVLTAHGVTVLRNARTTIVGLNVIGLDDFWGPCFDPRPVLATIDPDAPNLVLCHNPDVCDLPVWGKHRDWILAGHTHGGQCKPPFLPPPLLPVKNRRYTSGEFALSGGRRLYINRGVGHLTQVRFNARPEITVFRLTAG